MNLQSLQGKQKHFNFLDLILVIYVGFLRKFGFMDGLGCSLVHVCGVDRLTGHVDEIFHFIANLMKHLMILLEKLWKIVNN